MGTGHVNKVHLQKGGEDFVVIVEDRDALENWKKDSSIPLAQVVDAFKVYTTHGHGPQGIMDSASKSTLEGAFGTSKEDDVIITILREGKMQATSTSAHESSTNDSKGSMANHR